MRAIHKLIHALLRLCAVARDLFDPVEDRPGDGEEHNPRKERDEPDFVHEDVSYVRCHDELYGWQRMSGSQDVILSSLLTSRTLLPPYTIL